MHRLPRRAVLAATALAAGLGCGCEPEFNWRDVTLASASVQLPCKPDRAVRPVRLGEREWPVEMVACDRGGFTWAALSVVAPGGDRAALAGALRQAMAANLGADAAASGPAAQGGFADGVFDRALQLNGRRPDGSPAWAALYYAGRGEQVIELVALLPKPPTPAQAAALAHFHGSVQWRAGP